MAMRKNAGRKSQGRDVTWGEYKACLPGTTEQVAKAAGVTLRQAEKSLGMLRRLKLVRRDGEVWRLG